MKQDKKLPTFKCCICGQKFTGYGNNPYPVKEKGRCCDECDNSVVIPTRIKIYLANRK